MKRALSAVAILGAVALSPAQIKLKVSGSGVPESIANYSHKILPDGSKQIQLVLEFPGPNGAKLRVRVDRSYAADGSPIRVFSDVSSDKPKSKKTATATFNAEGAHVVIDENGKRTVKSVPLAAAAPRQCVAEFWFLRDKPKVGTSAKYYHFDIGKLEWRIVESVYLGPTTFSLGGTKLAAHRIKTATGEAIVDGNGLPLRIVDEAVTMTRISSIP